MKNKDKSPKIHEVTANPRPALYKKIEPIKFRLKKARLVDMDSSLKRIYKIKN